MPLLTATDPLGWRPCRVTVAGASGAGKSTVAARIAAELDITYVELDHLFHGPNWTPNATFVADIDAFTAQPGWVTEWQHRSARTLLVQRADLMVWLDLARFTVLRHFLRRSVRRRYRREVLWNGNVEPPLRTLFTDPAQIAEWMWSNYQRAHDRVVTVSHEYPDLTIVRLPDRASVYQWLNGPLRQSARLPATPPPVSYGPQPGGRGLCGLESRPATEVFGRLRIPTTRQGYRSTGRPPPQLATWR